MRYSIAAKFIAFLLATVALIAALFCGGYAWMLESYNLYDITPEEKKEQWYMEAGYPVAWRAASEWATMGPGGCSKALAEQLYGFDSALDMDHYYITVRQGDEIVHTISEPIEGGFTCEYAIAPQYPKVIRIYPAFPSSTTAPETDEPEQPEETPTTPSYPVSTLKPVRIEQVDVWEDLQKLIYELYYYDDAPTYMVSVTMAPDALKDTFHSNLATMHPYRYTFVWVTIISLLVAIAAAVYLFSVAGRTKDGQVHPEGLNRLPLDAYLAAACVLAYFPAQLALSIYGSKNNLNFLNAGLIIVCGMAICLLCLAVLYALAAQVKIGKGYWWRHSVIGICLLGIGRGASALLRKMNLIWQWLTIAILLAALTIGSFVLVQYHAVFWTIALCLLCCGGCLAAICYAGYCFGTIIHGAKRLSQGDLEHIIPTEHLYGGFRDCARQMNALSETTKQAVQSQVRSERMKTELITNVSHDIKTPLTSIINFVDLLGKAKTQEDRQQYLEVLSRQSNQLKKLIEDLMDLSKASSGNMSAHITTLDAVETVNQALGEYADKLEKAQLIPVFHAPEEQVLMAADGRLTWRVLSNLLNNAVKYATPGTRVYVDLEQEEDKVLLSVKNISREELRISPEELMERFVRGDASRNKEGSGLGLNIAKSLMEVQHGNLELLLDGDLFKVTLTFPAK